MMARVIRALFLLTIFGAALYTILLVVPSDSEGGGAHSLNKIPSLLGETCENLWNHLNLSIYPNRTLDENAFWRYRDATSRSVVIDKIIGEQRSVQDYVMRRLPIAIALDNSTMAEQLRSQLQVAVREEARLLAEKPVVDAEAEAASKAAQSASSNISSLITRWRGSGCVKREWYDY